MSRADEDFIKYWETHRLQEKRWLVQIMVGLPLGLVFGLPILLSFLLRGWYKRMPFISNSQFMVIIMALIGIVVFYAIYRMKFKWELNEQRYNELIALKKKEQELQTD
jgi:glycopeptide antibiotics resistance protein